MHELPSKSPNPESKGTLTKTLKGLLMVGAGVLTLTTCSPKTQSYFGSSIDMGKIPDDACMVDGHALIINANTESDGAVSLVYVRNNGDLVVKHYDRSVSSLGTKMSERGEFFWAGESCPTPTPTSKAKP